MPQQGDVILLVCTDLLDIIPQVSVQLFKLLLESCHVLLLKGPFVEKKINMQEWFNMTCKDLLQ